MRTITPVCQRERNRAIKKMKDKDEQTFLARLKSCQSLQEKKELVVKHNPFFYILTEQL